jgi:CHAD domain-containing protein
MANPPGLLSRHPEEGARLIALSYLDQAAAARPRLADPADPEALHDFRVALRRLRSCLRSYDPVLDGGVPRKLAKKLKRLAAATGPGRDAEVQLEWLRAQGSRLGSHHRAGHSWLLSRLQARVREGYEGLREEIGRDFPDIDGALRRWLSVYKTEVRLDPQAPPPTLGEATAKILRGLAAELADHLAGVKGPEDRDEAHQARISAKRVRYLLEPFAGEAPEAAPAVRRFKALQDLLGDLHDAHVLEAELAGAVEAAAADRARKVLEISLTADPDTALLRTERRRAREAGVIALARLNRDRRDRLFASVQAEWLDGRADGFLREVEALGEQLGQYAPPSI